MTVIYNYGRFLFLACAASIITSLLLFTLLEISPGILEFQTLQRIEYYALRSEYLPDSELVFVYRKTGYTFETFFRGDLYKAEYGIETPILHYVASYNELGFRNNSSEPPFDIIAIGDSYIETGENDLNTFSESLKTASGLSTLNLGRGWYGPYQYVNVLKRYGLQVKPKYALLCFFDGNDIEDITQYRRWLHEGQYYFYRDLSQKNFFERYGIALSTTLSFLTRSLRELIETVAKNEMHPDLGVIRLETQDVVMSFHYWSRPLSPEQLLASEEWQALKALLREFQRVTLENDIIPIIIFIPTKLQVYAEYHTGASGRRFLEKIASQRAVETNSVQALVAMTHDLQLQLINLLPYFKRQASGGKLLHHPFDTHWNSEGRRVAAEVVTVALKALERSTQTEPQN